MSRVKLTCDVNYGSYSGTVTTIMPDDDFDMDAVKGRIRRENGLNFLSMCSYNVKITKREPLSEYDDEEDQDY